MRRLVEYEQMKLAAARLDALPLLGRDFLRAQVAVEQTLATRLPDVSPPTCARPGPTSCKRAQASTSTTRSRASS